MDAPPQSPPGDSGSPKFSGFLQRTVSSEIDVTKVFSFAPPPRGHGPTNQHPKPPPITPPGPSFTQGLPSFGLENKIRSVNEAENTRMSGVGGGGGGGGQGHPGTVAIDESAKLPIPKVGASASSKASQPAPPLIIRGGGRIGPPEVPQIQHQQQQWQMRPPGSMEPHQQQRLDIQQTHRKRKRVEGPQERAQQQQIQGGQYPQLGRQQLPQGSNRMRKDVPRKERTQAVPNTPANAPHDVIVLEDDDDEVVSTVKVERDDGTDVIKSIELLTGKKTDGLRNPHQSRDQLGKIENTTSRTRTRTQAGVQSRRSSASRNATPSTPATDADNLDNTGDIVNRTMFELTTRNTVLEKTLTETKLALKSQQESTKTAEAKIAELSKSLEERAKKLADIMNRQVHFEKYLSGIGGDYNLLDRKNIELKNQLKETLAGKADILRDLDSMRAALKQAKVAAEAWGKVKDQVKETQSEIKRLQNRLDSTESELNQTTGLLVEERNRTQELESRIQEDRKINQNITEAVERVGVQISEKLVQLQSSLVEKLENGETAKIDKLDDCILQVGELVSNHNGEIKARLNDMQDAINLAAQSVTTETRQYHEQVNAATADISQSIASLTIQSLQGQEQMHAVTTNLSESVSTLTAKMGQEREHINETTATISQNIIELTTETRHGQECLNKATNDLSQALQSRVDSCWAKLSQTLQAQMNADTTNLSQNLHSQIDDALKKSLATIRDNLKQVNDDYRMAVDEKLEESKARRLENDARRIEIEARCQELLGQISRLQAAEGHAKQRINLLEAELSSMARQPPRENPELQRTIVDLNQKLADFTRIQVENSLLLQLENTKVQAKQDEIDMLFKDIDKLKKNAEIELQQERAKLEAKQSQLDAVVKENEDMAQRIEAFESERARYVTLMENERKDHELKSLAHWKKQQQKLQGVIHSLERQKEGREKRLKELEELISIDDTGELKRSIERLKNENSDLRTQLELSDSELKRLGGILDERSQDILRLEAYTLVDTEEQKLQLTIAEHEDTIKSLNAERSGLKDKIIEQTSELQRLKSENEDAKASLADFRTRNQELQDAAKKLEANEHRISGILKENDEAKAQIRGLQIAIEKYKSMEEMLSGEQRKNAETNTLLQSCKEAVQQLENTVESQKAHEKQLLELNRTLQCEMETLQSDMEQDKQKSSTMKDEINGLKGELEKVKGQMQLLSDALVDAQKERDKSQRALAAAVKVRDGQQSKINALEVTSHELSAALDKIKRNQRWDVASTVLRTPAKSSEGARFFNSSPPSFDGVPSTQFYDEASANAGSEDVSLTEILENFDNVGKPGSLDNSDSDPVLLVPNSAEPAVEKTPTRKVETAPVTPRQQAETPVVPPEVGGKKRKRASRTEESRDGESKQKRVSRKNLIDNRRDSGVPSTKATGRKSAPDRTLLYDGQNLETIDSLKPPKESVGASERPSDCSDDILPAVRTQLDNSYRQGVSDAFKSPIHDSGQVPGLQTQRRANSRKGGKAVTKKLQKH
ncbi:hypothetical protein K440DRAFT_664365 [Wilcoxina mikolae CBS 423.85]|nr:hypothetical protein K440DRAFT_664365 [Wilcoxina mikolae CBS 423.85]